LWPTSRHYPVIYLEGTHEKPQSEWLMSHPRFELTTSQIQVKSITARANLISLIHVRNREFRMMVENISNGK